jgi:hypothetical protein
LTADAIHEGIPVSEMVPIRYLGFWDVPRNFLVRHDGELLLFDCPFSDELDDYPDVYSVYALPEMSREEIDADWPGLPAKANRKLGDVPIARVRFDATLRKEIGGEVFQLLHSLSATNVTRSHPARLPTA